MHPGGRILPGGSRSSGSCARRALGGDGSTHTAGCGPGEQQQKEEEEEEEDRGLEVSGAAAGGSHLGGLRGRRGSRPKHGHRVLG